MSSDVTDVAGAADVAGLAGAAGRPDPGAMRLISWNMGCGGPQPMRAGWDDVLTGDTGVDVALLQEAPYPTGRLEAVDGRIIPGAQSQWTLGRSYARTAVARLSDRVEVTPIPTVPVGHQGRDELGATRPGSFTAARVRVAATDEEIVVVSLYSSWDRRRGGGPGIYADASMHQILSDLTPLLSWPDAPVIIAGDFNAIRGSTDVAFGANWVARNDVIFDRLASLGLVLTGPVASTGDNVSTWKNATGILGGQLDYCFATHDIAHRVRTAARDGDGWGPSDHCRLDIAVDPPTVRTWSVEGFLEELGHRAGPDARAAAHAAIEWATRLGLRLEFLPGPAGHLYLQLDGPDDALLNFTFSMRTRGDLIVQFQHLRGPYTSVEARNRLRGEINALLPDGQGQIGEDRINGRPAFPLDLLADPVRRDAFLRLFTAVCDETRAAAR